MSMDDIDWKYIGLKNNFMFCRVLRRERNALKEILEILLKIKIKDLRIDEEKDYSLLTPVERRIRCYALIEGKNEYVGIEIQTAEGADADRRVEFFMTEMVNDKPDNGMSLKSLTETYFIFICISDPFFKGECIYEYDSDNDGTSEIKSANQIHRVFFNASAFIKADDDKLKELLCYFYSGWSHGSFTESLHEITDRYRGNKDWEIEYTSFSRTLREHTLTTTVTAVDAYKEFLSLKMIMRGMDEDTVAEMLDLSGEKISEMKEVYRSGALL